MDELPRGGLTRIAPTPSGYLHAGNALNFLLTARLAEALGARILLRIDDLDAARTRPEYLDDVFRSLEWLGIRWDIGPSGPEEFHREWSQHRRLASYEALLQRLVDHGVLYACDCSRTKQRVVDGTSHYPGTCRDRNLPMDTPGVSWRLRTDAERTTTLPTLNGEPMVLNLQDLMPDPVLRQRDGMPAYQTASLADDEHFGTTWIVRGLDLLPSSCCQRYIADLLGMESFRAVRFVHHELVLGEEGAKLSKSAGAASIKAMREAGRTAAGLQRDADGIADKVLRRMR